MRKQAVRHDRSLKAAASVQVDTTPRLPAGRLQSVVFHHQGVIRRGAWASGSLLDTLGLAP